MLYKRFTLSHETLFYGCVHYFIAYENATIGPMYLRI